LLLKTRKSAQPRRDSSVVSRHSYYSRAKIQQTTSHFEAYLQHQALSPVTVRNYLADLRAFVNWHSTLPQPQATFVADDFRNYREYLLRQTKHSPATVNRRLQSLRLFGRFLHEREHAKENPAHEIRLVENGNHHDTLPRTLSRAEVERLNKVIQAEGSRWTHRDYAIIQLMLYAGLLVHEIAELQLGDLTPMRQGMSLQIHSHRQNRQRVIPLNAHVARALRDYLSTRPAIPNQDHLFVSQRGQPLSMRSIQRLTDDYARAAGLEHVGAQTLRNTFAKNMIEETRDVTLVARWLGCRSTKSLDRYATGG
jgi:site-specific recombinase XerD